MNPRKPYLLTKHFKTSSCLQTNSMKRGEVILWGVKKQIRTHRQKLIYGKFENYVLN